MTTLDGIMIMRPVDGSLTIPPVERARARHTGVVDENVDLPECLRRFSMDAFDVGGLGHIAGDRNNAAARIAAGHGRCAIRNGFGRGLQRFRAAGRDHDVGTGRTG
jgi:hypothetical protein